MNRVHKGHPALPRDYPVKLTAQFVLSTVARLHLYVQEWVAALPDQTEEEQRSTTEEEEEEEREEGEGRPDNLTLGAEGRAPPLCCPRQQDWAGRDSCPDGAGVVHCTPLYSSVLHNVEEHSLTPCSVPAGYIVQTQTNVAKLLLGGHGRGRGSVFHTYPNVFCTDVLLFSSLEKRSVLQHSDTAASFKSNLSGQSNHSNSRYHTLQPGPDTLTLSLTLTL